MDFVKPVNTLVRTVSTGKALSFSAWLPYSVGVVWMSYASETCNEAVSSNDVDALLLVRVSSQSSRMAVETTRLTKVNIL